MKNIRRKMMRSKSITTKAGAKLKRSSNLYGNIDEFILSREGTKQSKPASVLKKEKARRRKLNKINRRR
tara:strand:- start:352 stop:558 length:207 start_codon:yes stop_codon:yes gene_type:complete